MMNALSVHWKYNGSSGIDWNNENWNGGNLTNQSPNTTAIIYIPIVRSGRDKLLYFNEHNDTNNYGVYLSITVNDNNIERLRTSYDNPFSRHFNSKPYCRFLAARVPAQYLGNENFVKVTFKTVTQVTYFHFRECGLIDYYP
jgi:hypothetical protein